MPPDLPDQPPLDPSELIARAKREAEARQAEQMLARMQEDDEQDDRDGVELSDSSRAGPGSSIDSADDWDLSGRVGSSRGSSAGSSVFDEGSLSGGATMPEQSPQAPKTLNLPIEINPGNDDPYEGVAGEGDAAGSIGPVSRAPRYRPERRPPMAILVACDDGRETGEELRVRRTPFDVGRVEGDLIISHDHQMSRRHFRIERRQGDDWQWTLKDLDSLNGTFLRRLSARIDDGDELLVAGEVVQVRHAGGSRLRLTKVGAGLTEERVTLDPGEHLLGADRGACVAFLAGTPLLAPRHVRLVCDRSGRWNAAALPGTDGLWLRTASFPLEDGTQWQTGEQRFVFRLP